MNYSADGTPESSDDDAHWALGPVEAPITVTPKKLRTRSARFSHRTSCFAHVPVGQADALYEVNCALRDDPRPTKIGLAVGQYRNDDGTPHTFEAVRIAEKKISFAPSEPIPSVGVDYFCNDAARLLFGYDCEYSDRIATAQTPGGTAALSLLAVLLRDLPLPSAAPVQQPYDDSDDSADDFERATQFEPCSHPHAASIANQRTVYIAGPGWPNYEPIFRRAGYCNVHFYSSYHRGLGVDEDALFVALKSAPRGSIFVFQACASNPTGADLSESQWLDVTTLMSQRELVPLIDAAYLGFASPRFSMDAKPVRFFGATGIEFYVAQSFSKNFSMYGCRIGAAHAIVASPKAKRVVLSRMADIARTTWGSPVRSAAVVVATVLGDPDLRRMWREELHSLCQRMMKRRKKLLTAMREADLPGQWGYLTADKGMFSMLGLSTEAIHFLRHEYAIYIPDDGRISFAALTDAIIELLVPALRDALARFGVPVIEERARTPEHHR